MAVDRKQKSLVERSLLTPAGDLLAFDANFLREGASRHISSGSVHS
jgi:hypothetical protein